MLAVQNYLRQGKSLEDLKDLGIKSSIHPTKPLVILNYDQIESPKTNQIVRECRGLVLEIDTWDLVAKGFDRFFNWGEVAEDMPLFNFSNFVTQSKEDGSLALIYNYKGEWMLHTRGAFGHDLMQFQEFTWSDGIRLALGDSFDLLNPEWTYICEFVSPWNKVVRSYSSAKLYLLSISVKGKELKWSEVDNHINMSPFLKPVQYRFTNIDQIQDYLIKLASDDPTNEGVVIRDDQNRRWKIKNPTYLALHRMKGEGDNLYDPKNILPFVMSGEVDELLTYFPEITDKVREMEREVNHAFDMLEFTMWQTQGIEDQKDFALAIQGKTPFTSILFNLRKLKGPNLTFIDLRYAWIKSESTILKVLYRN